MVSPYDGVVVLFAAGGGPAFSGSSFCQGISYQTRVLDPLPYVHAPCNPGPDLSGSADAQRLRENNVGEDKISLGVPTPCENPLPFRGQDIRKLAPQLWRAWRTRSLNEKRASAIDAAMQRRPLFSCPGATSRCDA